MSFGWDVANVDTARGELLMNIMISNFNVLGAAMKLWVLNKTNCPLVIAK
jgi:hypothetical protein